MVVTFAMSPMDRQTITNPGSIYSADSAKARPPKPGAERTPKPSPQSGFSAPPSAVAPTRAAGPLSPESVSGLPIEETEGRIPEAYVEHEGETWIPEGMDPADARGSTPETGRAWKPVVILPPGVTAEFEDSPDDEPLSFDNVAHRRVTRSTVRAGASGVRGRR